MNIENINKSINTNIIKTNDDINNKIAPANADIDKSVEIRHNIKDKELQQELADFDSKYLNDDERKKIADLNIAEKKQLGDSRHNAAKTVLGSVKVAVAGPVGAAFGIAGSADGSQRLMASEKKLYDITDEKSAIRSLAQERQDVRYEHTKNELHQYESEQSEQPIDDKLL